MAAQTVNAIVGSTNLVTTPQGQTLIVQLVQPPPAGAPPGMQGQPLFHLPIANPQASDTSDYALGAAVTITVEKAAAAS